MTVRDSRCLRVLLGRRVEGLIILANSLSFETELLNALESQKIPSVILGQGARNGQVELGGHGQRKHPALSKLWTTFIGWVTARSLSSEGPR